MKQQRSNLRVFLLVLIAGATAAAIAYHFSTEGVSPVLASIQAEPVELASKVTAISSKVDNQISTEENNQVNRKSEPEAPPPPTMSALSTASIESQIPSSIPTVSRRSHRTHIAGNGPRPKSP